MEEVTGGKTNGVNTKANRAQAEICLQLCAPSIRTATTVVQGYFTAPGKMIITLFKAVFLTQYLLI